MLHAPTADAGTGATQGPDETLGIYKRRVGAAGGSSLFVSFFVCFFLWSCFGQNFVYGFCHFFWRCLLSEEVSFFLETR